MLFLHTKKDPKKIRVHAQPTGNEFSGPLIKWGYGLFLLLQGSFIPFKFHHDDVIKWKYFPRYWQFVRGIHRSPVNSPHKGQWRGALMFSFICVWINGWVNDREAGDLRCYRAHYDVIVMMQSAFVGLYYQFWLVAMCVIYLSISTINKFINTAKIDEIPYFTKLLECRCMLVIYVCWFYHFFLQNTICINAISVI